MNNYAPVWSSIRRGAVGFSESYITGGWDSSDITAVLRFYLQNRHALNSAAKPVFFKSIGDRCLAPDARQHREGARRNISAHYDLGNDFYKLWLDPSMTYSSAYFGRGANALEEAQRDKYRAVLHAIKAEPGGHILEIGCGWGGFAEEAVRAATRLPASPSRASSLTMRSSVWKAPRPRSASRTTATPAAASTVSPPSR